MPAAYRADDWITIYQSELAARAVDRESHEHLAAAAEAWAAASDERAPSPDATGHDEPAGCTGTHAPARPASAGSAPDADRDERADLIRRIAALERRLPPRP